nr:4Fe-4S dicluster domain-containing protein [Olsenella profusa]
MKAFAGGQLLDAAQSPFGWALTRYQCLQYALDTPGVVCVVPGVRDRADLHELLGFFDATDAERDYSVLSSLAPEKVAGRCVYCNHCAPCPVGINVGLVNKYYDLARAGDVLAADHYAKLDLHASDCVGCGHCDVRCPFGVVQSARMSEIVGHFGR